VRIPRLNSAGEWNQSSKYPAPLQSCECRWQALAFANTPQPGTILKPSFPGRPYQNATFDVTLPSSSGVPMIRKPRVLYGHSTQNYRCQRPPPSSPTPRQNKYLRGISQQQRKVSAFPLPSEPRQSSPMPGAAPHQRNASAANLHPMLGVRVQDDGAQSQ